MNRRVLRNALFLAGEAEKKIRAQGRPSAPAEELLVALWPAAKAITKAARYLDAVDLQHELARAEVGAALEAGEAAVNAAVGAYVAAGPHRPGGWSLTPGVSSRPWPTPGSPARASRSPPGRRHADRRPGGGGHDGHRGVLFPVPAGPATVRP